MLLSGFFSWLTGSKSKETTPRFFVEGRPLNSRPEWRILIVTEELTKAFNFYKECLNSPSSFVEYRLRANDPGKDILHEYITNHIDELA